MVHAISRNRWSALLVVVVLAWAAAPTWGQGLRPAVPPSYSYSPEGLVPQPMDPAYGPAGGTGETSPYPVPPNPDAIGPCCTICGGGSGCPPLWSTFQGVRILARTRASDIALGTETVGNRTNVVLTGKSFSFDIAPGYEGTLRRYLGRDEHNFDWFGEIDFWGFNSWVADESASASARIRENTSLGRVTHGSLDSPFGGAFPGLDWADTLSGHYNSQFNSAEANLIVSPRGRPDRLVLYPNGKWQRECQPGHYLSFLFGVRYFNVEERFELNGAGTFALDVNGNGSFADPGDIAATAASGNYVLRTSNDMIGLNLGADLMFRDCCWEWGLRFKVSPMVNNADLRAAVATVDPLFGNSASQFSDGATELGAAIEFGVLGNYKLRPNLAIHAGYDIAWLVGVALAPDQAATPSEIDMNGSLFFQGLTLGLEWSR